MSERQKAIEAIARGRVVVLAGEGLLRTAGLQSPACRGGLWDEYGVERCATPQALVAYPGQAWAAFSAWQSQVYCAAQRPEGVSVAHQSLVQLHRAGLVRGVICTTTDGLIRSAGIDETAEIHGAIDRLRCPGCQHRKTAQIPYKGVAPRCPSCSTAMRPDMVLFGEELPRAPRQSAASWVYGGGSLLVLGADLTRPPIHRIPEEMMQEGGLTIALGEVARGAVTRVRGVHLGGDIPGDLPQLIQEAIDNRD